MASNWSKFNPITTKERIMQIRSANSATHQPTKKCDPIIIAFDRNWNELYRERLSMIDGMAYGVREDYEIGRAHVWTPVT